MRVFQIFICEIIAIVRALNVKKGYVKGLFIYLFKFIITFTVAASSNDFEWQYFTKILQKLTPYIYFSSVTSNSDTAFVMLLLNFFTN